MAGANSSESNLMDAYGGFSRGLAKKVGRSQLGPLLQGLGMGDNPQFEDRLANSEGPLADAIRGIRGFAGTAIGDATDVGARIAAAAPAQYQQIMDQIRAGLDSVGGATGGLNVNADFLKNLEADTAKNMTFANQGVQDAFDPTRNSATFNQAADRMMPGLNANMAARGIAESGAAGAATEKALNDLNFGFVQNQQQNQQNALAGANNTAATGAGIGNALTSNSGMLGELGKAGAQIAGMGNDALSNLGTMLSQKYNMPMQTAGNLMSLLTSGLTPGIQMTGATAPIGGNSSKGWSVL